LLFLLINHSYPDNIAGFAIPCATDIAFAMCIFNLLARNFSAAIGVFLLSIAIFDDLGSMLIIASCYNHKLAVTPLLIALAIIGVLFYLDRQKISNFLPYLLLFAMLWLAFISAGIHATMAGVVLGAFIPMHAKNSSAKSPLKSLQQYIYPWVNFAILPLFSFVTSGVGLDNLQFKDLLHPLSLGVIVGLFLGKQIGIFGFTFVAVKLKLAKLPQQSNWFEVYFVACLAGIGFTMSLFIASLAFESDHVKQDLVTIGILASAAITTIFSAIIIRLR
jgi:NhaA family Na+:H+ antiporter